MEIYAHWAPFFGVFGLLAAGMAYLYVLRQPAGNQRMMEIADLIQGGAMTFLRREYQIIAIFMAVAFGALYLALNPWIAVPSLVGIFSIKLLENLNPAAALRYSSFVSSLLLLVFAWAIAGQMGMGMGVYVAILAPLL